MVSVAITKLWLNLASDTSQSWSFDTVTGLQASPTAQSTQEIDGDGTVNTLTTPGVPKSFAVTLAGCSAVDRQTIEFDLLNVPVWVRDDRSRKFAGSYSTPVITEHQYNDECDIALTFLQADLTEAV